MDEITYEVVLPEKALKQPSPAIYSGGDCGPCCLGGILGKSVQEIYDLYEKVDGIGWPAMRDFLDKLKREDYLDRFMKEIPLWPTEWRPGHGHFGFPGWQQNLVWGKYILMALDAGYCGITGVSYDMEGPPHEGDHWVLIRGFRERREPGKIEGATSIIYEILVSCSSRFPDGKWVSIIEFLRKWGGYNILLVRKK